MAAPIGAERQRQTRLIYSCGVTTIRCDIRERDRYQRLVGVCFRADGREVNRWLVESGNALDWVRYSHGAYAGAEKTARSAGIDIWRGNFQLPCEVRARRFKHSSSC
ncbi:thermonuclease family protein [Sinorhizobium meliloti]|nr:thermonuclease family protein [Sinorhizobium meliloti]MDE4551404.1 thermonuclease family protein [Sinorhizobium meliloti]MDE4597091.1 thermonuclease family protein [Sinorhizobium meliloti]